MKKFILIGIAVALLPLLASAYNPVNKTVLTNRVAFNKMLTIYPELRNENIKLVPTFAKELESCFSDDGEQANMTDQCECPEGFDPVFTPGSYQIRQSKGCSAGMDTIYIRQESNPFAVTHYILHEFGHDVYYTKLNKQERKYWEKMYDESPLFVSRQSRRNASENFAEWFAHYKYGSQWNETYSGVEMLWNSPQAKFLDQVFPKYRKPL